MNWPNVTLSPKDRRTLLAGVAAIAALVIVGRGWPAWLNWDRRNLDAIDRVKSQVAGQDAALRARMAIHDSLLARGHRLDGLHASWVGGDTPAGGAASLATLVSDAASRSSVTVGALTISSDSLTSRPTVRVRVQAHVTGDIRGIATLLDRLEGAPVHVVVRALSIQAAELAATSDRAEVLEAQLLVEAQWHAPAWSAHR